MTPGFAVPAIDRSFREDSQLLVRLYFEWFCQRAMVELHRSAVPGNPAIEVITLASTSIQAQWSVVDLLSNLFQTKAEKKLLAHFTDKRELVEDVHRAIWPGQDLPDLLVSKHEADSGESLADQSFFLKRKTVPTSLAFSWILWAVSHGKRLSSDKKLAIKFFHEFFTHAVGVGASLNFQICQVGTRELLTLEVTSQNSMLDSRYLWNRVIYARIVDEWNICRLNPESPITSYIGRPSFADLICFAFGAAAGAGRILQPLVLSMLAQFAKWVDENVRKLSVQAAGYIQKIEKNRMRHMTALTHSIAEAAQFYLNENEFCPRYPNSCVEQVRLPPLSSQPV